MTVVDVVVVSLSSIFRLRLNELLIVFGLSRGPRRRMDRPFGLRSRPHPGSCGGTESSGLSEKGPKNPFGGPSRDPFRHRGEGVGVEGVRPGNVIEGGLGGLRTEGGGGLVDPSKAWTV